MQNPEYASLAHAYNHALKALATATKAGAPTEALRQTFQKAEAELQDYVSAHPPVLRARVEEVEALD